MALESDDEQTVYATDHDAVLVSCDSEFSRRRRKNAIGRHVYLNCPKPAAAEVLARHLDDVIALLQNDNVTVTVTRSTVSADFGWD
jgi:hypothetical protein